MKNAGLTKEKLKQAMKKSAKTKSWPEKNLKDRK